MIIPPWVGVHKHAIDGQKLQVACFSYYLAELLHKGLLVGDQLTLRDMVCRHVQPSYNKSKHLGRKAEIQL